MNTVRSTTPRPPTSPGKARVVLVGVGGLGCPAASVLCDAGIGHLALIDPDRVELSNLPRQLLFQESDLGAYKAEAAAVALARRFKTTEIETCITALNDDNADHLFADAHFIIDATDGMATKLLVNDAALRNDLPYSYAGVVGLRGQTMTVLPSSGSPCLRCVFAGEDKDLGDDIDTCTRAGIIGPLAGLFGAIQATQALAHLADRSRPGIMTTYDASTDRWMEIDMRRAPRCASCAGIPSGRRIQEGESQSWAM